jgi:hypothetical protein
MWEGKFHTHKKQQTKLYIFVQQTVQQSIVNCMVASIPWI